MALLFAFLIKIMLFKVNGMPPKDRSDALRVETDGGGLGSSSGSATWTADNPGGWRGNTEWEASSWGTRARTDGDGNGGEKSDRGGEWKSDWGGWGFHGSGWKDETCP